MMVWSDGFAKPRETASVDKYMRAKQTFSDSHDEEAYRLHCKRFAGEAGFAGTTVSFVNFTDELPYFIETVLPLLKKAGLRVH